MALCTGGEPGHREKALCAGSRVRARPMASSCPSQGSQHPAPPVPEELPPERHAQTDSQTNSVTISPQNLPFFSSQEEVCKERKDQEGPGRSSFLQTRGVPQSTLAPPEETTPSVTRPCRPSTSPSPQGPCQFNTPDLKSLFFSPNLLVLQLALFSVNANTVLRAETLSRAPCSSHTPHLIPWLTLQNQSRVPPLAASPTMPTRRSSLAGGTAAASWPGSHFYLQPLLHAAALYIQARHTLAQPLHSFPFAQTGQQRPLSGLRGPAHSLGPHLPPGRLLFFLPWPPHCPSNTLHTLLPQSLCDADPSAWKALPQVNRGSPLLPGIRCPQTRDFTRPPDTAEPLPEVTLPGPNPAFSLFQAPLTTRTTNS